MAHHNGIIYVDTSGSQPLGVSIETLQGDVEAVLSRNESDLGLLCSDKEWYNGNLRRVNVINKWAKYKPIIHTEKGFVTAAQRIAKNQGFVVDDSTIGSTDSLYQRDVTRAFNAADENDADWLYATPTGDINTSPFRIMDFACVNTSIGDRTGSGYNHYAKNPFELHSIGRYPNDGTANGTEDFAVTWYYRPEQISFTDMKIYNDLLSTHTWYWGIFAQVPGENGAKSLIPIMSTLRGSTKLAVGSPSSDLNIGYFTLNLGTNTYGDCKAFLGIYAVNNTTQEYGGHFIYAPLCEESTFYIMQQAAEIRFDLNRANTGNPSATQGVKVTYAEDSSHTYLTGLSLNLIVLVLPSTSQSLPSNLTVTFWGASRAIYQGVSGGENRTPDDNTTITILKDQQSPQFFFVPVSIIQPAVTSPVVCDDPLETYFSIEVKVGSETSFYIDPLTTQHYNHAVERTIGEVQAMFGNDVVLVVETS